MPRLPRLSGKDVIGGGAYVYLQKKQENPPASGDVTLPQATSTILTTKQTTSTAQTTNSQALNWKTYVNTQYEFQLDYIDGTKLPDHMYGPNDDAIRFQPVGAKVNAPGSFVINVMSIGSSTCSSQTKAGQTTPFTPVTINGDVMEDPVLNRVISSFKFNP